MFSFEPVTTRVITVFALAIGLAGCPRDWGVLPDAGSDEPDAAQGGVACGSRGQPQCERNEYCHYPASAQCGAADAPGECEDRPEICDDLYAAVCGCDGKTYPNDCTAAASGTSVAYTGECKEPSPPDAGSGGTSCGGLRGQGCPDGEYCKFDPSAQCGAADQTGTCSERPDVCTRIYAPVCGCDGKTYGNDCEAAAAGASIVSKGECKSDQDAGTSGQACGGLQGLQCPSDQFCNFPPDAICGAADATGICEPIPQVCTADYRPVCGCDGKTYGNACAAHGAGVSVQAEGECKPSAQSCGGLRGQTCAKGEYCNFPPDAICGFADATGTCAPIPGACTKQYKPVCGCDGNTYGNACTAAAAGVSVSSQGECGSNAGSCGGLLGTSCPDGQYCNYAKDALCGAADQTGICTDIPDACTQQYSPVCGCDDNTYGNACLAAAAGISVSAQGECASQGSGAFCGGFAGKQCEAKSEYCNFPESTNCGSGDQGGTCERIPEICTLEYNPVCGCDGKTYGTRCAAAGAGVSVRVAGECP